MWLTGNSVNIMSLGGLALAIGILVDMSTVVIENVHVQLRRTKSVASAVDYASSATSVPILLSLLCVLSVFVPAFIMQDPLRALFMPLTIGVGFAMIAAYVLSTTLVPVMCVYLLKHKDKDKSEAGPFARVQKTYSSLVERFVAGRIWVAISYLVACGLVLGLMGMELGTELFPQVDSGEFVLRFRPAPGSNYKLTREMALKCLEVIAHEAKPENIKISMGFAGQVAPNFGMDNIVLFMRGPDDGYLRIALREDSGIKLNAFRERLRKILPERVIPWLAQRLEKGGLSKVEAQRQAKTATFGFQPGDIVTEVMSFGSMTPVSVRVVGTNLDNVRQHANKVVKQMKQISYLRDINVEQMLDYPAVRVDIDREKAGLSDIQVREASKPLIEATSSSRFIALNYWVDVNTGFDYQVEVLVPPKIHGYQIRSRNLAARRSQSAGQSADSRHRPGARRQNARRNRPCRLAALSEHQRQCRGRRHGPACRRSPRRFMPPANPPRGVRVMPMGQLPQMLEMFKALGIGLAECRFS